MAVGWPVGGACEMSCPPRQDMNVTPVERWNGRRWSFQSTVPKGQFVWLSGVSCPSANYCIAVGFHTKAALPFAERWNGRKWSSQRANPGAVPNGELNAVSCSSPTACITVGTSLDGTQALAERWNGKRWSLQPTPDPDHTTLMSVSCASARACTAVGDAPTGAVAERWNGQNWSIQSTPALANPSPYPYPSQLQGVSCPSTTSCTAVGSQSLKGDGPAVPLIEHCTG
jgi:hypothetical protein